MTAKTRLFSLILAAGFLISALPALAIAQSAAASRQAAPNEDPKAQQVRDQFVKVLQQYPPTLGTVLKADPSLINDQYLAPYPAVLQFLAQHPEVRRSPAFYLEAFRTGYDAYYYDYGARAWNNMIEMGGVFVIILTIALSLGWLIRTAVDYRRWGRLTKVQAEAHTKLLDRFTGNEELIAYVKSPAGMKFLQSSPISLDGGPRSMAAPLSRILWSMQAGVVILSAGIGMNFVSRRIDPEHADQIFLFGVVLMSLGIGFVVSAAMSYLLSKRLGLFATDSREARDVVEGQ